LRNRVPCSFSRENRCCRSAAEMQQRCSRVSEETLQSPAASLLQRRREMRKEYQKRSCVSLQRCSRNIVRERSAASLQREAACSLSRDSREPRHLQQRCSRVSEETLQSPAALHCTALQRRREMRKDFWSDSQKSSKIDNKV
jgi:hypothetical protein